jgi:hypothetical protein
LISISFIYFASGLDASGPAEAVDVGNGVGRKKRESCENVTSGVFVHYHNLTYEQSAS